MSMQKQKCPPELWEKYKKYFDLSNEKYVGISVEFINLMWGISPKELRLVLDKAASIKPGVSD